MSAVEQGELLHFITSCPRQPLRGFGQLNPLICVQVKVINWQGWEKGKKWKRMTLGSSIHYRPLPTRPNTCAHLYTIPLLSPQFNAWFTLQSFSPCAESITVQLQHARTTRRTCSARNPRTRWLSTVPYRPPLFNRCTFVHHHASYINVVKYWLCLRMNHSSITVWAFLNLFHFLFCSFTCLFPLLFRSAHFQGIT